MNGILFRAQKTERLFQFMHKSAPYLRRVKNSKKTSKCQVFFYSTRKPKSWTELARRGPSSAGPRSGRRETILNFSISIVSKHQKIEEVPFGELFSKKSHNAEKNLKGGPFSLARYCMLRGKTGKFFLFHSARPNGLI